MTSRGKKIMTLFYVCSSVGLCLTTCRSSSWSLLASQRTTSLFPDSISTHNIPSGSDVRLGDSASNDIRVLLKLCFKGMGVEDVWIEKALDYLIPRTAGIFIWATTIASFLRMDPRGRFDVLQTRNNTEGLNELYSLYSTVVRESFGGIIEEEILGVIGVMIFARQPLNDDTLIMESRRGAYT